MTEKVQWQVHGEQERTYACRHIMGSLGAGRAVVSWPRTSMSFRPDAWCKECEQVRKAEGGAWTNRAMEFVATSVLCGACYDWAKSIWLEARRAGSLTDDP